MSSYKLMRNTYNTAAILIQLLVIGWVLVSDVRAQYEYESNEGPSQQSSRMAHLVASGVNGPQSAWDNVNQAILEKCIQMQTMTLKKRNFGLEIPDIIMNRVQGGTEGSTNLKELRTRMLANGK